MTPQEQQLIQQLAQRVNQTQLTEKDPDAENLLGKELGANPDALYILAQTVLVQDITLQRANAHIGELENQIAELQQQLEADEQEIGELQQAQQRQPAKATSFLGRIFGEQPAQQAPPQSQYQPVQTQYSQPGPAGGYQPVPQYAPPARQYAQPQYPTQYQPQYVPAQPQYIPAAPMGGVPMGGQPSFLQGAMQTAAGVAAGTLAVEGVESLLHGGFGHPGYGGGFGGGYGMGGFGERPVEEVVNNYYGDSGEHEHGHEHHEGSFGNDAPGYERFEDNGSGISHSEGARFADTSNDSPGNDNFADDSSLYDSGADNIQLDDSGSYDDNGSF